MDHFHGRPPLSAPDTSNGTFSILEAPPVSVRSSIPPAIPHSTSSAQPMQTFNPHQLTMPPPPPPPATPSSQKPAHANTFVHKLYNMVVDSQYQHLIAWNYTGSSFIVCNIMEFSRDVLPKHFKHNNFSSFVRQLNMYGFHKVNKSPRGHRTLAENQIWEFSHPKFLRNRADLLDDIKRKAMESSDTVRREAGDLHAHMAMMQVAQSDMMQQIGHLFENFNQLVKELAETRRKQADQLQMMKDMAQYISQHNGGHLPPELNIEQFDHSKQDRPPSIFVTSHDHGNNAAATTDATHLLHDVFAPSRGSLSIQTQNLLPSRSPRPDLAPPSAATSRSHHHGSLGTFGTHLPPSPSPSTMVSDDESNSLYSPHSPHTPQHQLQQQASSSNNRLTQAIDPSTPQPAPHNDASTSFGFLESLDSSSHR
ncbi:hypothetical protein VTP01DRAFT_1819 [Rhizomucor pusillus]|uniref:uncharacterized protein n=1 Tax=Rhizomucor pusillus TaxID=4840 RepID=UPI0037423A33